MSTVTDLLPKSAFEQKIAYIFDHGKMVGDSLKYQDAATTYGWNKFRYNKVVPGTPVLNRRPGKLTKTRKFEIFGGGFIESIGEPDDEGNVVATISHPFEFVEPIRQGDPLLEAMNWECKTRKPNSWANFWHQYGMNKITINDFINLTKGRNCISIANDNVTTFEDASDIEGKTDTVDFEITIDDDNTTGHTSHNGKRKRTGRHVDYSAIQSERDKVGALGEDIVLKMLIEDSKKRKLKAPIHVSKIEGDGLGYDIRAWDDNEQEIYIEVKTTKTCFPDRFDISKNELAVSRELGKQYKIYRVYNLDVQTGRCRLRIYNGPLLDEDYRFEPTSYKVYVK